MALTRMPQGASLTARFMVRAFMAALVELYGTAGWNSSSEPRKAMTEEMLIMLPPPFSFISRATLWVRNHTPRTLTWKSRSHCSRGKSSVGAPQVTPALFTRMSMRPKRSTEVSNSLSMSSAFPRSQETGKTALPKVSSIFPAAASRFFIFRDARTRSAPASARPAAM